jgi:selenocysteine lyase/cysteine desulfurase
VQNYSHDFGPFDGAIWLNCSHQGALPRIAAEKLMEAVSWKIAPQHLTQERFNQIPKYLKELLGQIIQRPAEEIILANSASYGLHLVANGMRWNQGDEVLVLRGDFPSDILPWLGLADRGVRVRYIKARAQTVTADELSEAITPATKLFCCTWIHSFTGGVIDAEAIGDVCRKNNVRFVMNCSQGLGARVLDLSQTNVDAITCVGFKYLCGPYGTGFCWMQPEFRESLHYNKAYWLSIQTAEELGADSDEPPVLRKAGAKTYDVFGTANFFNFVPWTASLEYLLQIGVKQIAAYDQSLVTQLLNQLDREKYYLISPEDPASRSTLIVFSSHSRNDNAEIYERLRQKQIFIAFRRGNLRISPHLYNTPQQIDEVVSLLNST